MEAINIVFREALTCETDAEVAVTCLSVAEELTGSKFGFIGELNPDGRFDTIAISNPGWDACKMPHSDATRLTENMEIRGIDRSTLREEKPRIVNDPASHPDSVGVPPGHPPITCFLGVPLKQRGKTIGMIALANKPSGYDPADQEAVEALSVSFVEALSKKRAEVDLRRSREELEQRVEERTAEVASALKELRRSNADLEQFASVASHDLQEPLRVVAGFVQLLARRYRGKLDSDADEFVTFAVDGTKRMQRLIDDLLAYSRVGTRGEPFASLDTNEVVDEALVNLEAAVTREGAAVTCAHLPDVVGDRTQFLQLFQNLLGNAIKFHGHEAPRVHVSAKRSDNAWTFAVQDNGIGIDSKHAEHVFAIFQRLHARTEYSGTGIGLAVCKRIVERHGGRIWFNSEPGAGTVFCFTIPDREEPQQDDAAEEN